MNLFTEIRKETRMDYYGVPYEAVVYGGKKKNLGQLWDDFKKKQKESEKLKESNGVYQPGQYQPINEKAINNYHEINLEPKK